MRIRLAARGSALSLVQVDAGRPACSLPFAETEIVTYHDDGRPALASWTPSS